MLEDRLRELFDQYRVDATPPVDLVALLAPRVRRERWRRTGVAAATAVTVLAVVAAALIGLGQLTARHRAVPADGGDGRVSRVRGHVPGYAQPQYVVASGRVGRHKWTVVSYGSNGPCLAANDAVLGLAGAGCFPHDEPVDPLQSVGIGVLPSNSGGKAGTWVLGAVPFASRWVRVQLADGHEQTVAAVATPTSTRARFYAALFLNSSVDGTHPRVTALDGRRRTIPAPFAATDSHTRSSLSGCGQPQYLVPTSPAASRLQVGSCRAGADVRLVALVTETREAFVMPGVMGWNQTAQFRARPLGRGAGMFVWGRVPSDAARVLVELASGRQLIVPAIETPTTNGEHFFVAVFAADNNWRQHMRITPLDAYGGSLPGAEADNGPLPEPTPAGSG